MNRKLKAKIFEVFGSQADFAQAIGENESVVSRVIRGRCEIDPAKKKKWAKILRCRWGQLFPALTRDANSHPHEITS